MEAGLQQVIRRTREKWTPTHVLQALYEGRAFLFLSDDGFFVLQPSREDWTSMPLVTVWAMWFRPGTAKEKQKEIRNWLDQVTNKRARMSSPRMGWGKALGPDWEIERIVWRRKK